MEKRLRIGDLVVASCDIRELDDRVDILHARAGDMGVVIGLEDPTFPTVRFEKSATDCAPGEIALLRVAAFNVGAPAHA